MMPWNAEDLTFDESRFHGKARLFPLTDFVLFPHVMQPLHIFEPRYLELLREALDSDGLIAMGVPVAAWTGDPGAAPLRSAACLGKVVTHQRRKNGRYNLLLLGVRRLRIVRELPGSRPFREAEVALVDDVYPPAGVERRETLQSELCELFQQFLPEGFSEDDSVAKLLTAEASLGALTDLVSFAAPLPHPVKCDMLAQTDVDLRAAALCGALARHAQRGASDEIGDAPPGPAPDGARRRRFPPPFSTN